MKGIYFTTMCNIDDPSDNENPGIKEKICQQFELFKNAGIQMYFYYAHVNSKIYKYINRLPLYKDNFKIDSNLVKESSFIYMRKPSSINMGFITFLKNVREINPQIKMLLEIPTFPYDNEIKGLVRFNLKVKDRYARQKLKNYIDVILTYSNDKEIFGIKTINLRNGVDVEKISKVVGKYTYPDDGTLRLMACAKFNLWHGYDRAIEGLYNYLKNSDSNPKIEIEMVGDGESIKFYKRLVEKYGLQKNVIFHGKLQGEELAKIYSISDIGLDSMGRHRSGVYYNSSLKGKEYCAYGLMIVSGVETELDTAKDFKYYLRMPADETPIDFTKIVNFYNTLTSYGEKRKIVRNAIMNYAKDNFSMKVVFQPVINFVKENQSE